MKALVQEKVDAIAEVCRRFNVARLELFGSACTPEFNPECSDLDFLVEFLPGQSLGPWMSRLFELEAALAALFGRKVDLIMPSALRNPWFRREAEKTRTVIYDAFQVPEVA